MNQTTAQGPSANQDSAGFNHNYNRLRQIAETMKNQKEPDIDGLVQHVSEATQAYKVCSERLDEVSKLIDEMLDSQRPADAGPCN